MKKIKVNIVLEILGRPKEHIKEALVTLIMRMASEKGVKIVERQIREPVEVKDTNGLYTTFAEVSLELDSVAMLLGIIMAYMPAHIEVVEPDNMDLTNYELNEIGNALLHKLHNYDAIVKKALVDRNILESRLREVAPELFKEVEQMINVSPARSPKSKKERKIKKSKKNKK